MPLFYLVDSIVKNVGGPYISLFSAHIVAVFKLVFAEVLKVFFLFCFST